MARIRVGGVSATDPPVAPRIRVGGISATAPAVAVPRIRIGGVSASGAVALVLNTPAPQTVDSLTLVTVTATLAAGSATPDSYVWRIAADQTASATLSGSGASRTLISPADYDDHQVVVGIKAVKDGVMSPEVFATINVRQHNDWLLRGGGAPNVPLYNHVML